MGFCAKRKDVAVPSQHMEGRRSTPTRLEVRHHSASRKEQNDSGGV